MNREMQRVEAAVVQRCGVRAAGRRWCGGGVCFIASLIAGYTAGWRWVEAAGGARKEAEGREPSGQRCCAVAEQENEKGVVVRWCAQPGQAWRAGVGVIGQEARSEMLWCRWIIDQVVKNYQADVATPNFKEIAINAV